MAMQRGLYLIHDTTNGGFNTRYEYDQVTQVVTTDETTSPAVMSMPEMKARVAIFNQFVKDVESILHPTATPLIAFRGTLIKDKNSTDLDQLEYRHRIFTESGTTAIILMTYTDTDELITINPVVSYQVNWSDFRNLITRINDFVALADGF